MSAVPLPRGKNRSLREDVVQRVVCGSGDGANATTGVVDEGVNKRLVGAEAANFDSVIRRKVTAAGELDDVSSLVAHLDHFVRETDLILNRQPCFAGNRVVHYLVVRPLLQREEPEDGAENEDDDRVEDQHPISDNETGGDMVLLHNSSN